MMTDSLAVRLTKQLVAIESTDPGVYEGNMYQFLHHWLEQLPCVTLSEEEVLPGRRNLMAELPGGEEGKPSLVFICHMDTVVVGDGWSMAPFDAVEKNGRIYGRGACDMKSGLACCLSAFSYAADRAGEGVGRRQGLKLICTVDEEDFMRGVEACIRSGWIGKDDWILDAEPTGGRIQAAHKGRLWYEIQASGRTAHASTPWKGADAIAGMAELIRSIRLDIQKLPVHPQLGPSTVTFGQITGGYRPYVVPDSCKLWIDIRMAPPLDADMAGQIVERAITLAREEIPGLSVSYRITGNRPPVEGDDQSPLLNQLSSVCQQVTGEKPAVSAFPGYTDTAVAAGRLGNHNCMSYGPGNLECAHQPDEWVEITDILRCEQVFQKLALTWMFPDS